MRLHAQTFLALSAHLFTFPSTRTSFLQAGTGALLGVPSSALAKLDGRYMTGTGYADNFKVPHPIYESSEVAFPESLLRPVCANLAEDAAALNYIVQKLIFRELQSSTFQVNTVQVETDSRSVFSNVGRLLRKPGAVRDVAVRRDLVNHACNYYHGVLFVKGLAPSKRRTAAAPLEGTPLAQALQYHSGQASTPRPFLLERLAEMIAAAVDGSECGWCCLWRRNGGSNAVMPVFCRAGDSKLVNGEGRPVLVFPVLPDLRPEYGDDPRELVYRWWDEGVNWKTTQEIFDGADATQIFYSL
ncbi:unnamed protein product [Phaeothamnion confervicola]